MYVAHIELSSRAGTRLAEASGRAPPSSVLAVVWLGCIWSDTLQSLGGGAGEGGREEPESSVNLLKKSPYGEQHMIQGGVESHQAAQHMLNSSTDQILLCHEDSIWPHS